MMRCPPLLSVGGLAGIVCLLSTGARADNDNHDGVVMDSAASVVQRFEQLDVMCDGLLDDVTASASGTPADSDVQAAANCFADAAKQRASAMRQVMDSLPEPSSSEDCERNVPILTALMESATPFWGSIRETMVRPAADDSFKHAADRLCNLMSYYLNSYTCLDHVDVAKLHQTVHRDLEIYQAEAYEVADEVNQLPGGASREDEFTIFPCIDLGQSVVSILMERADAEHAKAYEDGTMDADEADRIAKMRDLTFAPLSEKDLERQAMYKDAVRFVPLVDRVVYQEVFVLGEGDRAQQQQHDEKMPPGWESMRETLGERIVTNHKHDNTEL